MFDSAKALAFENVPNRDEVSKMPYNLSFITQNATTFLYVLTGSILGVTGSQ